MTWWVSGEGQLFNHEEYRAVVGRYFDPSTDFVAVMNADYSSNGHYLSSAVYKKDAGIWFKTWNGSGSGSIRVNYLIATAA